MKITPYQLAERFVGLSEVEGAMHNPQILAMLRLDAEWPNGDEVPWCSAFVNYIAWLLRLPRSKSLRARSWLDVGLPVSRDGAGPGWDVVVLSRGPDAGHVGFFSAWDPIDPGLWRSKDAEGRGVLLLGGNQGDGVNIRRFKTTRILGIRRLGRRG